MNHKHTVGYSDVTKNFYVVKDGNPKQTFHSFDTSDRPIYKGWGHPHETEEQAQLQADLLNSLNYRPSFDEQIEARVKRAVDDAISGHEFVAGCLYFTYKDRKFRPLIHGDLDHLQICDRDFDRWANSVGAEISPCPRNAKDMARAIQYLLDCSVRLG